MALDVFDLMAPQLGLALTGGNATLGQGGTLGGPGHFSIGLRANVFSGDLPEVTDFPTPSLVGRQQRTGSLALPGFHLTWTPEEAVVSTGGDMGYTYGMNSMTVPDSTGKTITFPGRYVAVWRKGADGRWRCVQDIFNNGPAPAKGPA